MSDELKPWWFPEITDAAWCDRIRKDYPEDAAGMDDDDIREQYANGCKYADLWDHVGDARSQFEALADAYLSMLASRPAAVTDDVALLNLIADIRAAAGDKDGKLMQDELVARIAGLRVDAERYQWLVAVAGAHNLIARFTGYFRLYRRAEVPDDKAGLDAAIDDARSEKPPA
jgi:hypothetical protein